MPVFARITLDPSDYEGDVQRIVAAKADLTPAHKQIGDYMRDVTDERFADQVDPEGNKWDDLADSTWEADFHRRGSKFKTLSAFKDARRKLHRSGDLSDSIFYDATGEALYIGSNLKYAATHNEGAEITIPEMKVTDKMRSFFWARWYATEDDKWKHMAFAKKIGKREIEIPQRQFIGTNDDDQAAITRIVRRHFTGS